MQPAVDVPIYSLDDAIAALRTASVSGTKVRLRFPYAAASSLGPDVLCQIVEQARLIMPEVTFDWLVECGDEPGIVLAMLHAGVRCVQFDGPEPLRRSIIDIAGQYSAVIESLPPSPDAAIANFRSARTTSGDEEKVRLQSGGAADGGPGLVGRPYLPSNKSPNG